MIKRPTFFRTALNISFLFFCILSYAQNLVPFTSANGYNQDIKGDILLIGNNILGQDNNAFNDNTEFNSNIDMRYIDIDGDNSTFSSSSADLVVPNPNCYEIKYAALYWGAVERNTDQDFRNVKFRGPIGGYIDITGTVIYDRTTDTGTEIAQSLPYACFADVTDIVTGFGNNLGTYTVANVSSREGFNQGTGQSAGWSLFVVYEDPTLPGKSITSFNGFSVITGNPPVGATIPITGFRTIPTGPVRANFAFAALEGDSPIPGDQLVLNGTPMSALDREIGNFFDSSVTQLSALPVNNRVPNSTNTLGFDTGIFNVPNPENNVIANGATSAIVDLTTTQDTYFPYFFAMAVEIIAPNVVLTKIVEDDAGVDVGGQTVGLGQSLNYVIGFQNTGNDDANNTTIRDILPLNIIFNPLTDLVLPAGVTVASYNPATREIIFNIADFLVEQGDPVYEIRIETEVVQTCSLLADACSNIINNQAFTTYQGTENPDFIISDDPSFSSNTGCLLTPQATNFLADLDDCIFTQNEILCGATVELTAGNGYDTYSWSTSPTGTPVIGTTQTITVSSTGTYYSFNTAIAPCQSIVQEYVVTTFGADVENPVLSFADEIVICPNDGKQLPNIYLCGANASRLIDTNISDASSIIWEKLDESSCAAVVDSDCANEDATCIWNQVATGPDFTADTSGQYRLTLNYEGGCFNQFYFNVYQNLLNPDADPLDIICTTPGSITVTGVPNGYEFSLDNVTFQNSNVFSVTTAGLYTAYIRQIGINTNPCIFTVPDIQIRARDFTVSTLVTQPLCNGDLGSIRLAANDVDPQYFFALYDGATLVNSVGPITENNYTFQDLNPGTYRITVETEDGCTYTENIDILEPALLTATSALTSPLTCTDGEITVYPVGGTGPYFYFVNSTTDFQTVPEIVVTAAGIYNIRVVDSNNCTADTQIEVNATPAPDFTVDSTNILCADTPDTGNITINVTNANGNTLAFSVDNGVTFSNSSAFSGLAVGDYEVIVQYTLGTDVCTTTPQTVTITANTAISGMASLIAPYTCTSTGTIEVTGVTGGTIPYSYSIDGVTFQPSNTFTNLTNGTYSVTVQDGNNCTFITNEIIIAPLDPPTDLMFSSTALTCPSNTSDVTITTTGGSGTLEYQIIAPTGDATVYQGSNTFSGLAPGTYTFQVQDANDCVYSESYTIDPLPALTVVGQTINDVSCFGASDGAVRFTVSGSTGFTYTINGGSSTAGTSPIDLTGLAANTYTIVITDTATSCTATDATIVNAPPAALMVTATESPITCIVDGSVEIATTGGWGGNAYSLTLPNGTVLPSQANNTFNNLTQTGTYTATVVDANGCSASDTFVLNAPIVPTASISSASDFCYDTTNGATIEVAASGGVTPYQYNINGGPFQTSNVFDSLVPNTYIVIVRDAFGCEFTLPAQIIEPQLTLSTVLTKDLDCTASPDAVITGTIAGGSGPYDYSVSINSGTYSSLGSVTGTSFTYSPPTVSITGTFQFQITDALGCTAESGVITINPITDPDVSISMPQNIICNGESNGSFQVDFDPTVGTAPFTINVNNDTTSTNYGTQTSGLPAGTYTVTITDAKSCTDTATVTLSEPNPIVLNNSVVNLTCGATGISPGQIIIDNVTGGTGPYDYYVTGNNGYSNIELNNAGTSAFTLPITDFGVYQINVVDANGCSLIRDTLIAAPPSDLNIAIDTVVDCLTGGEAVVSIGTSLSSMGPFFFDIYRGTIPPPPPGGTWQAEDTPGSESATFTGLTPGLVYTFIIYDSDTNCYYSEEATTPIPTNSTLTTSALSADNITCNGSADGDVSFTVNSTYGVSTGISYEIFNASTQITTGVSGTGNVPAGGSLSIDDLGPLPVGNYYVLINETSGPNSGCGIVTTPFDIIESAVQLSLTPSVDQNANCNANSGVISVIGQNGTPPYLYQITTTPASPLAGDAAWASASTFNVNAGNYFVHVLDAFGCVVTTATSVNVPMDPTPVVSAAVNNQCNTDESNFEIDVTLTTAGIAPHSYSVDGGAFQTQTVPFTIANLSSGPHTIEVQDANGCGNLVTVNIESPLGLTPTVTALPSCDNNDGELTVAGFGGTGTYTYAISPSPASVVQSGSVFTGVPSGTYTITVTDVTTTCTENVMVTLEAAIPVTFTSSVRNVLCNGESNGEITINLSPGNNNPIYTYEITAPIIRGPQNSNVFSGLAADTYTVRVTSGRNCLDTRDIQVIEPTLLDVSGSATAFECAADNSVNTVTLTVTETAGTGTAPYTYSINGANYFTSNTFDIADTGSAQTITVYVQDANGCVADDTVNIAPLPTLTNPTVTISSPVDCNNTGEVTVNVTGGSGNLTYQMLPDGIAQGSNTFTITTPGDYFFQVNDLTTNCTIATAPFTVNPFDDTTVVATATAPVICFGDTNGIIELNVSDYTGNYTYEVFDSSAISVSGSVTASTTTNPQSITGLSGGSYTVVVTETDSPFCSTTSNTITISSPSAILSLDALETSNVSCVGNRGTITAQATGGWGSYEYELTGAATVAYSSNGTFPNLGAGSYTVNVRDAQGCIASDAVTLAPPPPINVGIDNVTTILTCFGDTNGSITVSASGGAGGNYTYILNTTSPVPSASGPQSSPVFENLGAGTYSVSVVDPLGCFNTSNNVVITQPTQVEASLVVDQTQRCTSDASLTLTASGGTGPYTYNTTSNFTTNLGSFTTSITFSVPTVTTTAATYSYYIQDANNCISRVSNAITIEPIPDLEINLASNNPTINCTGDNTGVIDATALGGLGNYSYTLTGTSGGVPITQVINSTGFFDGLFEGTYSVTVDSEDCSTTSANINITEPAAALTARPNPTPVVCFGERNGSIEIVDVSGGTGIIKYAISPQLDQFFETNLFENLNFGFYDIIVQDASGCFILFEDIEIEDANPIVITSNSQDLDVCDDGVDEGMLNLSISGGNAPYRISLDDGEYELLTGADKEYTDLGVGNHVISVLDNLDCEAILDIISDSVRINPIVNIEYVCTDNTPGNIVTVTVDDSILNPNTELSYSLDGGPFGSNNVFIDVAAGVDHYIDVMHNTVDCSQTTEFFDIIAPDAPLELSLNQGGLNEIVATTSGGTSPYQYTLNGEDFGTTSNFIIYATGLYTVIVTDSIGCTAEARIPMEFVDVCIPNYFTPNGDGIIDVWGPGCAEIYRNLMVDIFDRYGRKVAILRVGEYWDGKYEGKELPTGDYWYVVQLNSEENKRDFVGHFTLYR